MCVFTAASLRTLKMPTSGLSAWATCWNHGVFVKRSGGRAPSRAPGGVGLGLTEHSQVVWV